MLPFAAEIRKGKRPEIPVSPGPCEPCVGHLELTILCGYGYFARDGENSEGEVTPSGHFSEDGLWEFGVRFNCTDTREPQISDVGRQISTLAGHGVFRQGRAPRGMLGTASRLLDGSQSQAVGRGKPIGKELVI